MCQQFMSGIEDTVAMHALCAYQTRVLTEVFDVRRGYISIKLCSVRLLEPSAKTKICQLDVSLLATGATLNLSANCLEISSHDEINGFVLYHMLSSILSTKM